MALSGLDIYKLLPKTNCKECGFATCLAFAMQLAKKAVAIDKCPFLSEATRKILEESSLPPIRLVSIGTGEGKVDIGNETVLFRHEEKFHHPCAIGVIIEDNLSDKEIGDKLAVINSFKFERVGQSLNVNLVGIKQNDQKDRFVEVCGLVAKQTSLGLVLMSSDTEAQRQALSLVQGRKPLIYSTAENTDEFVKLAVQFGCGLVISSTDLGKLSERTKAAVALGLNDIVLDTGKKDIAAKIWDFTQIRRQALKKSNRSLGYPTIAVIEQEDSFVEAIEAASCISKYAGIVLIKGSHPWEALSLLTLRQNIYTDPQKPLQIEPKLYPVGAANTDSPVLVTTNFSLTYYTVLGEVEASKIPSYIVSVDTEGMSVLTAWAAEKFTPDKITSSIDKCDLRQAVSHKRLIIPGYVAVMSGELEDKSGWQVLVGPKEAAGIPAFLKNLKQ